MAGRRPILAFKRVLGDLHPTRGVAAPVREQGRKPSHRHFLAPVLGTPAVHANSFRCAASAARKSNSRPDGSLLPQVATRRHILGSSIASLNEIEETTDFTAGASYFLVKNFINNTSFFEWDQATHSSYFCKFKDAIEVTIPKLNEMAYEQVELASVPFLTFVANKLSSGDAASYSFVLRGYVRHWLGNVWNEYDRIKLNDIVAASTGPAARAQAAGRS
jgi:hypothetical protein